MTTTPVNIAPLVPSTGVIIAFFTLVIFGQLLLAGFFATLLIFPNRTVRRDGTILNLCVALFLWTVGASLLLYSGHFRPNYIAHEPASWGLCLAQAAVIYGSISEGASSVFSLVMHLWFSVFAPSSDLDKPARWWWRKFILVGLSWTVGISMTVAGVVWGLRHRDRMVLKRNGLYCSGGSGIGTVSSALSGVFMVFALGFECHLIYEVVRSKSKAGRRKNLVFPRDFVIRMSIYSVYAVLTIVCALLLLFSKTLIPFVFMASLPMVVFFLFGTGPDILSLWFCIKRKDGREHLSSQGASTELSDRAYKDGGPTTYLTSPFDVTSTGWHDQTTRPDHSRMPA
ncbi:hypothetical protein BKA62DRAFT_226787 [Auriculariales sp. MPI-PUGE-AT-0066]|nr:hypothetical protein BKA62DRAFT_226787 [Auriculariales sp. MPI-PUGE-AT-0066]